MKLVSTCVWTLLARLLVFGGCLFSGYTWADVSFATYSWLSFEISRDVVEKAQTSVIACVSAARDAQVCVGTTIHTCIAAALMAQCYNIEAAAWELFGYRFFSQIARSLPNQDVLQISQNSWIRFAQAECALTSSVDRNDIMLQQQETARCALVLSAMRTLMLRAHAVDMKINDPRRDP